MGMAVDLKLYKGLLIIIDLVFLAGGIALIGLGSWALADYVEGIAGQNLAVGLIVLGCVAFLIAFVGCIGAFKENRGALKCYAIMVLVLMLIQLALGITAYVLHDQISGYASSSWDNLSAKGKSELEHLFNCCGWNASDDRPSNLGNCTGSPPADPSESISGCEDDIVLAIQDSLTAIGVTAIVIGVIELLVVLFSCCLIQRMPTEKDREQALLEEARRLNRDTDAPSANYSSTTSYQTYK